MTGGSRGTGAAIAMGFAKEGAEVAVNDINEETGRSLSDRINSDESSLVSGVAMPQDYAMSAG